MSETDQRPPAEQPYPPVPADQQYSQVPADQQHYTPVPAEQPTVQLPTAQPVAQVPAEQPYVQTPATQQYSQPFPYQQMPQNQPYQQMPSGQQVQVTVNTVPGANGASNPMGVAGFVLALVAFFLSWVPVLNWILWILGAVFSVVGIFKNPKGFAIAGAVISFIWLIISLILIVTVGSLFGALV